MRLFRNKLHCIAMTVRQYDASSTNAFFVFGIINIRWAKVYIFFSSHGSRALPGLLDEISRSQTHHTRQDSSEREIDLSQRPLPDKTQHSQETDIHARTGIRTSNPSKRAAVDPRLTPRGHGDL